MVDVRARRGPPIPSDFSSFAGTPLVVDITNGYAYIMNADHSMQCINTRFNFYAGSGDPNPSLGNDGDFYLNTGGWWFEKETDSWVQIGSMKGQTGSAGPQGIQGIPGNTGSTGSAGADGTNGSPGTPGTVVSVSQTSGATASVTTTSGQQIYVLAVGDWTPGLIAQSINLNYDGVSKDSKNVLIGLLSGKLTFSMVFVMTPGAQTKNVTVTTSGGTLADVQIIVMKLN